MSDIYILDGHNPIPCDDLLKWGKWLETAKRHVGDIQVSDDVRVSTVFLGLDHNFGEGNPLLFETMIFGGKFDGEMDRYTTWEQAEEGHKKWAEKAKAGAAK